MVSSRVGCSCGSLCPVLLVLLLVLVLVEPSVSSLGPDRRYPPSFCVCMSHVVCFAGVGGCALSCVDLGGPSVQSVVAMCCVACLCVALLCLCLVHPFVGSVVASCGVVSLRHVVLPVTRALSCRCVISWCMWPASLLCSPLLSCERSICRVRRCVSSRASELHHVVVLLELIAICSMRRCSIS